MKSSTKTVKNKTNSTVWVGIVTGSFSNLPIVSKVRATLSLGTVNELVEATAHRTLDKVLAYRERAHREGVQIFIASAGMAAHLVGVIAVYNTLAINRFAA